MISIILLTIGGLLYYSILGLIGRKFKQAQYQKQLYTNEHTRRLGFKGQVVFDDKDPLVELKFGDLTRQPGGPLFVVIDRGASKTDLGV